jgi:hypothetical protein
MAQEDINRGSYAGDDQGEDLYTAFGKCISNFNELYTGIGATAIKAAYESNSNTEAFTTAEKNKLGTIEDSADVTDKTNVLSALDAVILDTDIGTTAMDVTDAILFKDATDNSLKYREVGNVPFTVEGTNVLSAGPVTPAYALLADGAGGAYWGAQANITNLLEATDEHKLDGTLVFPSHVPLIVVYNSNGTLASFTTENDYNGKEWVMTFYYDVDTGNTSSIESTDGVTTWTKSLTYNTEGQLTNEGAWV